MATIKYFHGDQELRSVRYMRGPTTKASSFEGYPEGLEPIFVPGQGWTGRVVADRMVEYKSRPSLHECDARCMNATGRVMKCECACGGRNHGRAALVCESV